MLTGKPTGRRPLRRPRRSWEDNITNKEIGINTRSWVYSAQVMSIFKHLCGLISAYMILASRVSSVFLPFVVSMRRSNSPEEVLEV